SRGRQRAPVVPYTPLFRSCAGALLALLSAVSGDAQAQSAVITGKVTGRGGEALGGATVLVEGLGISAGTAQSGTYTLTVPDWARSEEHTSELQSLRHLVCR